MVKVSKLRSMHAAVRRALLAAGSPNPCDDARVREAKAGFRRADIECRLSPEPVRVPNPGSCGVGVGTPRARHLSRAAALPKGVDVPVLCACFGAATWRFLELAR